MVETQTSAPSKNRVADILSSGEFAETQKRNATFFTQANELIAKASHDFLEDQRELLHLEVEHMRNTLSPPKPGENLSATLNGYFEQQHEHTEKLVAKMRHSSDLMRDYGWKFLTMYSNGFKKSS
ncbi:MAG: hypothetical protein B7X08_03235 [Acidocella sp. 20-63-7]|nr:MAG: hypothetical protein B7X08_03235 [Acidocella sp. 20-63-7]HQT47363.1 hypothetical protein [Acidocella sp.]